MKIKQSNKANTLPLLWRYIVYIGVIIEIAFIIYFSLTTKNVFSNSISLVILMFITYPLGMIISRLLFPGKNVSETIILSACLGLPFSTGIWGIMAFFGIPLNPLMHYTISFALPTCLLIFLWKKLKFENREIKIDEISISLFILLLAFLWHSLIFANHNVPTDVDAQGPSYLQLMMKYQDYPVIYPFLNEIKAYINYPPCFNVCVVLLSKLKMSFVYKECMSVTVVCGSYFALANFLLAYYVFKRNLLIAFIAGVLTLNRAYLTQYSDGNTTEMLSFLSIPCFLILLQHALNGNSIRATIFITLASGFIFSVSALSNTEIFHWHALSFAVFFVFYWVSNDKNILKDYSILTISTIVCLFFVLPWLIRASGNCNYKFINFETLFNQHATQLVPVFKQWHNPIYVILSFIGVGIFFFYRQKMMILLGVHAIIMMLLIIHWKFYSFYGFKWFQFTHLQYWELGANGKFTTPFGFPNTFTIGWMSFSTVFPIATACTLFTFTEVIRKRIKNECFEKYKIFTVLIVFFLSAFQYYEYKSYLRYPEWLLETDYQALQWFQKNTTFDSCLILNPGNPINLANGIAYWSSDWVPVVAERRAICGRSLDANKEHLKIVNMELMNKDELLSIYNNILQPDAYNILKKYNISHIFISALQTGSLLQDYQKASFLELAHYYSIPNLGTAVIYKVK